MLRRAPALALQWSGPQQRCRSHEAAHRRRARRRSSPLWRAVHRSQARPSLSSDRPASTQIAAAWGPACDARRPAALSRAGDGQRAGEWAAGPEYRAAVEMSEGPNSRRQTSRTCAVSTKGQGSCLFRQNVTPRRRAGTPPSGAAKPLRRKSPCTTYARSLTAVSVPQSFAAFSPLYCMPPTLYALRTDLRPLSGAPR